MNDIELYEEVEIIKTGERGYIVWFNEDDLTQDSCLIEIIGKNEMPRFYERKDFKKVKQS